MLLTFSPKNSTKVRNNGVSTEHRAYCVLAGKALHCQTVKHLLIIVVEINLRKYEARAVSSYKFVYGCNFVNGIHVKLIEISILNIFHIDF